MPIFSIIRWSAGLLVFGLSSAATALTMFEQKLVDPAFGEQQWLRLNVNRFDDVWPGLDLEPDPDGPAAIYRPRGVIRAWASFAWDSKRRNVILFGGGHNNYAGNEIYLWQSDTLSWARGSLPTQVEYKGGIRYVSKDGPFNSPVSSHTYDNNEYLPIVDRFVTFGGAAFNDGEAFKTADGSRMTGPYFWDPNKADADKVGGLTGSSVDPSIVGGQMWQNRDSLQSGSTSATETPGRVSGNLIGFLNGATGYATENDKDVLYVSDFRLWKYTVNDANDPSQDVFEKVGDDLSQNNRTTTSQGAGAYDKSRNIFLKIFAGYENAETPISYRNQFVYWDLDTAGENNRFIAINALDASGQFNFQRAGEYGLDYDPLRENFLLWRGDGFVWTLTPPEDFAPDKVDWTLQRMSVGGAEQPTPAMPTTGILGKWKYLPEYDIFLGLQNENAGHIWAYKPADWTPTFGPFNPVIFKNQFE